jgi:CheY-like chemotaxis protein
MHPAVPLAFGGVSQVSEGIMPHASLLIVIADDDKAIAALLYTIFKDEGYHVYACHSGHAAYKAIEQLQPDLAILDMQMEKRASGLEVVQRMRASTSLSGIPVIIYSADSLFLGEVRDRLVAHQCQILEKPFDLYVLIDMVARSIVQKERAVARPTE